MLGGQNFPIYRTKLLIFPQSDHGKKDIFIFNWVALGKGKNIWQPNIDELCKMCLSYHEETIANSVIGQRKNE